MAAPLDVQLPLAPECGKGNVGGVRLLQLEIQEPVPGRVLTDMAEEVGDDEAARRYRAIVVTTLRQLRGLAEARIRLRVTPRDAEEAVRFWLLPRLSERWAGGDGVFRSAGWEIDFGGGGMDDFRVYAEGEVMCPLLGARWVQAALPGIGVNVGRVVGPATGGGRYFTARAAVSAEDLAERTLPELPVIRFPEDWLAALAGPLGPALNRAWEEEA